MSKHPDIDKVRKYLIESGYPEDGDALLSLVAVEAELAPKTSNPHGFAEILADMDLIIEQEHGSEFGARSLKEHLISFRDRIESALASAEPVLGWANPRDVEKVRRPRSKRDGSALAVFIHGEQSEDYSIPIYTHAQPAAKVEALCSDCPSVGYPTDATRCTPCPRNSPTPASVPDGWAPTDKQYRAWCETHDMQESVSREAFDDAASLYLLEPTP